MVVRRLRVELFLLAAAFAATAPRVANAGGGGSPPPLDPGVANDLSIQVVVSGFFSTTAARYLPDGRLVIFQQDGNIFVYNGTLPALNAGQIPVDFDGGEKGLLGLAIDPQFATSNRLYIYYSAAGAPSSNKNRVAYVTIDPTTSMVDVAGRQDILMNIYGPANHDGGGLEFGPDGLLYVGAGDRGCNSNAGPGMGAINYNGTCLTNANGKILRIDREGGIPASNPLVGVAAVAACGPAVGDCRDEPMQAVTGAPREEIYVWGMRNPWRFTFDPITNWLWVADVGEITWEEITISKMPGEHHGFPFREGSEGRDPAICQAYTPQTTGPCIDSIFSYNHDENQGSGSITGGVFSHHCSWPANYRDRYFFADYTQNRVWFLTPNAARDGIDGGRTLISDAAPSPVHFFTGNDGAVYWVSLDGVIIRLAPQRPEACTSEDAGVPVGMDAAAPPPPDAEPGLDAIPGAPDAPPGADATTSPGDGGNTGRDATGGGNNNNGGSSCGCTTAEGSGVSFALALLFVLGLAIARRGRSK